MKSTLITVLMVGALPAASFVGGCSSSPKAEGAASSVGKGTIFPCTVDESAPVPAIRCTTDPNDTTLPPCNTWIKVELPGTVCSDGCQYKFFVNYSNTSNDLEVNFEPGGACWDYESCSGVAGGIRGAANPNGIPDDHMSEYQYLNFLPPRSWTASVVRRQPRTWAALKRPGMRGYPRPFGLGLVPSVTMRPASPARCA